MQLLRKSSRPHSAPDHKEGGEREGGGGRERERVFYGRALGLNKFRLWGEGGGREYFI